MANLNVAFVIRADGRYVCPSGRKFSISTAHSLAGAKFFESWETVDMEKIELKLREFGQKAERIKIGQIV